MTTRSRRAVGAVLRRAIPAFILLILLAPATARGERLEPPAGVQPPEEHPLDPVVERLEACIAHIDQSVQDYSCTFIKRETLDDELQESRFAFCKVRHQPFSAYMYFLKPQDVKGNHVIYVEGQNNGNLLALAGDWRRRLGWLSLDPTGPIPMQGNRYPVTQLGVRNLAERLARIFREERQYPDCNVDVIRGAKVNGCVSTVFQITHPVPQEHYRFHIARLFIDDELNVPIRYASYAWPTVPGSRPALREEYTYTKIKLNNGYTNVDFDSTNPDYNGGKK